jgi:hypothetical protein
MVVQGSALELFDPQVVGVSLFHSFADWLIVLLIDSFAC